MTPLSGRQGAAVSSAKGQRVEFDQTRLKAVCSRGQELIRNEDLKALKDLIDAPFAKRTIDLKNPNWHDGIPRKAGWYYLETDTPLHVFLGLASPPKTYANVAGENLPCRNYDLRQRANSLADVVGIDGRLIGTPGVRVVYSGMAQSLGDRAREHTFGHWGTAGLALSRYEQLSNFSWVFYFQENCLTSHSAKHDQITLKLGEQIWRAHNGWPLLCSG